MAKADVRVISDPRYIVTLTLSKEELQLVRDVLVGYAYDQPLLHSPTLEKEAADIEAELKFALDKAERSYTAADWHLCDHISGTLDRRCPDGSRINYRDYVKHRDSKDC